MTALSDLPRLGVGVVYNAALDPLLVDLADLINAVEIEPQVFSIPDPTAPGGYRISSELLKRARSLDVAVLIHGVGFPVGGASAPTPENAAALDACATDLGAEWVSEHLAFNRARSDDDTVYCAGFALPVLQTEAGVEAAVDAIVATQAQLTIPFLIETSTNYLQPMPGEIPDGEFVARIAQLSNCGILLDLHNIWANERNGRQRAVDFLAQLPAERIAEIHLAGGLEHRGYWLDAHAGRIPDEVMAMAGEFVPSLPNLKALTFEVMSQHVEQLGLTGVRCELERLADLWQRRSIQSADRAPTAHRPATSRHQPNDTSSPTPREWESTLAQLALGRQVDNSVARQLACDPGVELYRELIWQVRAGMVVEGLRLTCRLLRLAKGDAFLVELLSQHFSETAPELFAGDAAAAFCKFLEQSELDLQFLDEILALECAVLRVQRTGSDETVTLRCDPKELLSELGGSRIPTGSGSQLHEVRITAAGVEQVDRSA